MNKQVVKLAILQNAKLMAALYFVISIPLVALMTLPVLFNEGAGTSLLALIMLPLLYTAFGFVFTLFGTWVYNGVAARVGGFEFTTVEIGKESLPAE